MEKYYQQSGKFSPISFLILIAISFTVLPLLGLLYAYAIWYIPFIYINFIIAGILGFAIGFVVLKAVIGFGKVRNAALGLVFGLLAGLITLYFHWSVWLDLVINAGEQYGTSRIGITVSNIKFLQVFALASNPAFIFDLIGEVNKTGTWGCKSIPVSGIFLSIIWVLEALIIIVIPTFMGWDSSKRPFCEIGNAWFKEEDLPFAFIEDSAGLLEGLKIGSRDVFHNLAKTEDMKNNHSVLTLYSSENAEYYLSITNKTAKFDKKGEVSFDPQLLVQHISISNFIADKIKSV